MPRSTLLLIIEGRPLRDSIRVSLELAEEYEGLYLGSVETLKSEPFAFGEAARIQQRIKLPRALADPGSSATSAGPLDAIWAAGLWTTPGTCPPAPPDSNGATGWQWAHYNAVMAAAPKDHFILWDLYLRTQEGRMAA
ncbi:hypothetical protein GCM10023081_10500 [Arthrobacter ginkgonis]|uniref:Uncharacterized protein n=1 Tax=Arthrobacter ginkgonis TaxID=1630594 RepID=A0ABP7C240_9MICC